MIVDDEPSAHKALRILLTKFSSIEIVGSFLSPQQAIAHIDAERPELLFLDIDMDGMTGIEMLQRCTWQPVTVLVTAHPKYALDAFEIGAREYLVKPVSPSRLQVCMDRVIPVINAIHGKADPEDSIYIKCGREKRLLNWKELVLAESEGNFSIVELMDGTRFIASESLKSLYTKLQSYGFARPHRAYIVNKNYVAIAGSHRILLKNGKTLPVGRVFKDEFKE